MQAQAFSTDSHRHKYLIETDELSDLISKQDPTLRIMNASWYMPNDPRDPKKEHHEARLTLDTQHFDIDEVIAEGSDLPHTLPPLEIFQNHMSRFKLTPSD